MRTIAIINQKGGCGKTTVAINLAATLAGQGRRTLLVDTDPQSHCALGLAVPDSQLERSVADLLRHGLDGKLAFDDVVWQITRHLDLAPSTIGLAGVEAELVREPDRDRRLLQVFSTVANRYEFCIIDCPPSIGLLTFNALRAAGEVIIPVETGYFAMQGSIKQEKTIEMLARRAGHHVRFNVLATMYDVRTRLAREILGELSRHYGETLLPVVVHFNSKLKEAASFGQPITEYDSASRGMRDFEELVAWLLSNPPQPDMAADTGEAAEPAVATIHVPGAAGNGSSPALSRAAELVERARALSARTAALAAKLSTHAERESATQTTPAPAATAIAEPPPAKANGQSQPQAGPEPARTIVTVDRNALKAVANGRQAAAIDNRTPVEPHSNGNGNGNGKSNRERFARLYGAQSTSQGLLFVQPDEQAKEVAVAGDFNGWDPTPLQRNEQLGVWQACITVAPGRYRYRLVVDGRWIQDPYNRYVESNPYGELNNVVENNIE